MQFFFKIEQCIDGFSLVLEMYVENVKNPAILWFFFLTKINQLNTANA